MFRTLDTRHVALLVRTQLRVALGGTMGLVALGIFIGLGLLIAWVVTEPLTFSKNIIEAFAEAQGGEEAAIGALRFEFADVLRPLVAWWVDSEPTDPLVTHLLVDRPVVLSAYIVVLMGFVPLATCLLAFNQSAGDIRSKAFRYLSIRTARPNILIARFLASWAFVATVGLAVVLAAVVYIGLRFPIFPAGELLTWGFSCFMALVLLSAPYVALLAWVSASVGSPRAAWLLGMLATVGSYALINLLQGQFDSGGEWLDRLSPWGWKYELLHPDFGTFVLAATVMMVFAAIFLAAGVSRFARRDL